MGFNQLERGGVAALFARGQADGQKMFAAVNSQRRGGDGGPGGCRQGASGYGRRSRSQRFGERRFVQKFADPTQSRTDPEQRGLRGVDKNEGRLALERGNQFAQLGAVELDKGWGSGRAAAETLEQSESGELRRGGRSGGVELDLDRDGVAWCRSGEVGGEQETQHEGPVKLSAGSGWRKEKRRPPNVGLKKSGTR